MKLPGAWLFCTVCVSLASAQKLREAKFPLTFTPEKSLQVTIKLAEGVAVAHCLQAKSRNFRCTTALMSVSKPRPCS
jgi:hypothetical protein